ncbi:STAS-like domain-containing protein [Roseateles cavernae]|uniref:STAS-like domain-containing protein n=1 Tax=Roseateles cavernae TaxID=3153578 RepID=UPI0032E521FE
MVVKVSELTPAASSYEDGDVIFRLLIEPVQKGEKVIVDFTGITSVPSAFVNGAFVRLLEHVSFDQVRRTLNFVQSTRQINDLIRSRFEFVAEHRNSWSQG